MMDAGAVESLHDWLTAQNSGFMPHGMCYLWQPGILGLHVVSDAMIALAYLSIPFSLVYFIAKRTDLGFPWIFICFAVFIVTCGATHLMDIVTIWFPAYWLSGSIKGVTAVASVATAVLLVKLLPDALRIPSPATLQAANVSLAREVLDRKKAEENIRLINLSLEARVAQRTAQLAAANKTLTKTNARFAIASAAAGLGFWDVDLSSNSFEWDDSMSQMHGRLRLDDPEPLQEWIEILHPDDQDAFERSMTQVENMTQVQNMTGELVHEYRVVHQDGDVRHLRITYAVTQDDHGLPIQLYGVAFDITEERRAQVVQQHMTALVEGASDAIITESLDGWIGSWNPAAERLFGYASSDIIGRPVTCLIPADRQEEESDILGRIQNGQGITNLETVRLRKDGSPVDVSLTISPVFGRDGKILCASKILRDITPQRRAAETLRALNLALEQRIRARTAELEERESLLQEVHHRVKNNLQVISSLINMQARSIQDTSTRRALEECRSRVETMAQIHETLYQAKDYARVPFSRYARDLVNRVISASGISSTPITVDFYLDDLFLSVEKAIPCGLILNELISNALKHAFPDESGGAIQVAFRRLADNQVLLSVSDDGIGISAEYEPESSDSLGMQLVVTLVEQLEARLEIIRQPGTTFRIQFSTEPYT